MLPMTPEGPVQNRAGVNPGGIATRCREFGLSRRHGACRHALRLRSVQRADDQRPGIGLHALRPPASNPLALISGLALLVLPMVASDMTARLLIALLLLAIPWVAARR